MAEETKMENLGMAENRGISRFHIGYWVRDYERCRLERIGSNLCAAHISNRPEWAMGGECTTAAGNRPESNVIKH
jgi:hypothetical protein